jgi:hypothetical protein
LEKFKRTYDNCNVSIRWKDDPSLGKWVSNQRRLYKVEKLESLAFQWLISKTFKKY